MSNNNNNKIAVNRFLEDVDNTAKIVSIINDILYNVETILHNNYIQSLENDVIAEFSILTIKQLCSLSYLKHDDHISDLFDENVDNEPCPIPPDSLVSGTGKLKYIVLLLINVITLISSMYMYVQLK